jgi:trk system potassium uptake protein
MVLMFIGGAPGGTAGGVKITTFGHHGAALWATVAAATIRRCCAGGSRPRSSRAAFSISLIGFLVLNVVAGVLLWSRGSRAAAHAVRGHERLRHRGVVDGRGDLPVSLAGHFSRGRQAARDRDDVHGPVGPLTLAVAVGAADAAAARYPEGKILIG